MSANAKDIKNLPDSPDEEEGKTESHVILKVVKRAKVTRPLSQMVTHKTEERY